MTDNAEGEAFRLAYASAVRDFLHGIDSALEVLAISEPQRGETLTRVRGVALDFVKRITAAEESWAEPVTSLVAELSAKWGSIK